MQLRCMEYMITTEWRTQRHVIFLESALFILTWNKYEASSVWHYHLKPNSVISVTHFSNSRLFDLIKTSTSRPATLPILPKRTVPHFLHWLHSLIHVATAVLIFLRTRKSHWLMKKWVYDEIRTKHLYAVSVRHSKIWMVNYADTGGKLK